MSKLLSTGEVATLKGVTRQAVHLAIRDGRLKAQQAGRYWVVTEKDCEEWEPNPARSEGGKKGAGPKPPAEGSAPSELPSSTEARR